MSTGSAQRALLAPLLLLSLLAATAHAGEEEGGRCQGKTCTAASSAVLELCEGVCRDYYPQASNPLNQEDPPCQTNISNSFESQRSHGSR
ncbi:hypothetical protein T484DRAFT_1853846 [Baffinella frigidus]|nr:hypothetical protein T484DRAFT_1853846 [Cryptophyta sp. CCMP2293]